MSAIKCYFGKTNKQKKNNERTEKTTSRSSKLKHFGLVFPQVFAENNIGKGPTGTKTFTLRAGSFVK